MFITMQVGILLVYLRISWALADILTSKAQSITHQQQTLSFRVLECRIEASCRNTTNITILQVRRRILARMDKAVRARRRW